MHILFLTQVLPYPLDAGPKVRAYYVLRHLAQKHQVTLVSFVRSTDTAEAIAHLAEFCHTAHTVTMPRSKLLDVTHLLRSLVTGQPFIIARDWTAAMTKVLGDLLETTSFDAIHADQLWMAPYALWAEQNTRQGDRPLTVLDQHNAVYLIPERLAKHERNPLKRAVLALEAHKMARFEVETCHRFDRIAWVTQEDLTALQRKAKADGDFSAQSTTIPICVDPAATPALTRSDAGRRVTFLGGLHWPPNAAGMEWFVREVWPQVVAAEPDALLTVIGKDPPPALQAPDLINVHVTGYVDDPIPLLAETAVFIVPLHAGGGMRVKILDAWSWGLPIVSTTTGAEGIDLCAGENILIADSPTAFAEAVLRLLQQPNRATAVAQAGRDWVERRYDWRRIYVAWDRVYGLVDG